MIGNASPNRPPSVVKNLLRVNLVLVDGTALDGWLFVSAGERLQDLLNDPKQFLPFRSTSQSILILNKASIAICQPHEG